MTPEAAAAERKVWSALSSVPAVQHGRLHVLSAAGTHRPAAADRRGRRGLVKSLPAGAAGALSEISASSAPVTYTVLRIPSGGQRLVVKTECSQNL